MPRDSRLPKVRARLLRWHAEGWTAGMMAERLNASRPALTVWLRALGLVPHGSASPAARRRMAEGHAAEMRRVRAGHDARACRAAWEERQRRAAESLGWPEARTASEARILQALHERGPLRPRELAPAAGYKVAPDGRTSGGLRSALRRPLALGYVVRQVGERGVTRYTVGVTAAARRREREGTAV